MRLAPQLRAIFPPFLDLWTSKSGPYPSVFWHFDFEMCFSPQRRAIFQHPNFKKWSENAVFCTFWLQNVLLATAACKFSTSERQKVVRSWRVLYIFTWICASRHSGVLFFDIGTAKSGLELTCFVHFHLKMHFSPQRRAIFYFSSDHRLRTRRFNEPTFRLTRHTNHWINTAFRDFSNIWRLWIFFLLTFALLHLLSSDSTSSSDFTFFWIYFIYLLFICFSTLHIVGSLLFKLPSVNYSIYILRICRLTYSLNSKAEKLSQQLLQYFCILNVW